MRQVAFLSALLIAAAVSAQTNVQYLGPAGTYNTTASMPTSTSYLTNFGIAFTTGSTGPFSIDWVNINMTTGSVTSGAATFKLALHDTTNTTAYSAAAGSTELAIDTVTLTMPTTTNTELLVSLMAADIPNITGYVMQSSTAYSLIVYNASGQIGIRRTSGIAEFTTNDNYTSDAGFTALNTFRNNALYNNSPGSYPTLSISFGEFGAIPEPSTYGLILSGLALAVVAARRRSKK